MTPLVKKIFLRFAFAVGLISGLIGIGSFLYTPTPDSETWLFPHNGPDLVISQSNKPKIVDGVIKANVITIDGFKYTPPPKTLIIANQIKLANDAEIYGDALHIVSTQIDGGKISSVGSLDGKDGGDLFVVSALINGTIIEASGIDGNDGANGRNGVNGARGNNGRNGRCGAGSYRSAHSGGPGGDGTDGQSGENGSNGGNAGNIFIMTSYQLTTPPVANGGLGGKGGQGGAAGIGGAGGRGGSGCTGLGGSQSSKSSGAKGTDGKPGVNGKDGNNGQTVQPIVKIIDFSDVAAAYKKYHKDKNNLLIELRAIRPRLP